MTDKKGGVYIPVYLEWLEVTQDLTAEEKGNLIDAVVSYASGLEYDHLLSGGSRIAFRFLKGQVDRNREISVARRNARLNKQEQTETDDDDREQIGTSRNKTEQNGTNAPKDKEEKEDKKEQEEKKKFVAPTLEEVAEYMREIGCGIDPQYFLDYQTARNWVLSNGKKAKDWKAVIRTWAHNDFSRRQAAQVSPQAGKTVPAQQYSQRDYTGEQTDALRRMIDGTRNGLERQANG